MASVVVIETILLILEKRREKRMTVVVARDKSENPLPWEPVAYCGIRKNEYIAQFSVIGQKIPIKFNIFVLLILFNIYRI